MEDKNTCLFCKQEYPSSLFIQFSCNHMMCYNCLSKKIIIDQMVPFKSLTEANISCFCKEGKLNWTYSDLHSFLSRGKENSSNLKKNLYCNIHPGETVKYFCLKCKTELCEKCNEMKIHPIQNKHHVMDLETYIKTRLNYNRPSFFYKSYEHLEEVINGQKYEFIEQFQNETQKKIDKIDELIQELTKMKADFMEKRNKINDNMNMFFETILMIYKNLYDSIENQSMNVKEIELIKKIKKDYKSIMIETESPKNLEELKEKIKEFSEEDHFKIKYIMIHYDYSCQDVLLGHKDSILCLNQINNGYLISGSQDQSINVWDIFNRGEIFNKYPIIKTLNGHSDSIFTLLNEEKENFFYSGGRDDKILQWDYNDYKTVEEIQKKNKFIEIEYPKDVKEKSNEENKKEKEEKKENLNFKKVKQIFSKLIHVYSIKKLKNGNFVVGGRDETIKIFDSKLTKCIHIMKGHINTVFSIAELNDHLLVSGSADNTVKIWDCSTNKNQTQTQKDTFGFTGCFPNTQNSVAIPENQKNSQNFTGSIQGNSLTQTNFQPLGSTVSFGKSQNITKTNPKGGFKCIATYKGHKDEVHCVLNISGQSDVFASSSSDKTIHIVKFIEVSQKDKFNLIGKLEGHTDGVVTLIELEDGRIASGSFDTTIRIWDISNMTCCQVLSGHKNTVFCLYQVKDGRLISGSADRTIRIWGTN
ncbi:MAG: hypothetical protein MJ252_16290 [archaeon]|nr:hypothetical protein [archaeon]